MKYKVANEKNLKKQDKKVTKALYWFFLAFTIFSIQLMMIANMTPEEHLEATTLSWIITVVFGLLPTFGFSLLTAYELIDEYRRYLDMKNRLQIKNRWKKSLEKKYGGQR